MNPTTTLAFFPEDVSQLTELRSEEIPSKDGGLVGLMRQRPKSVPLKRLKCKAKVLESSEPQRREPENLPTNSPFVVS